MNAELFKTWFQEQFLHYLTRSLLLLLIMTGIVLLCCRRLLLQAEKASIMVWLSTKYVQRIRACTIIEISENIYKPHGKKLWTGWHCRKLNLHRLKWNRTLQKKITLKIVYVDRLSHEATDSTNAQEDVLATEIEADEFKEPADLFSKVPINGKQRN